jgi:hypothetical protein
VATAPGRVTIAISVGGVTTAFGTGSCGLEFTGPYEDNPRV